VIARFANVSRPNGINRRRANRAKGEWIIREFPGPFCRGVILVPHAHPSKARKGLE
jgi:hypothetical protein